MTDRSLYAPIPHCILPDTENVRIVPAHEPLVCISDIFAGEMEFQPEYLDQGLPGATGRFYVRKTVADMLLTAARSLPDGYRMKIYDAWRPAAVQKALFDRYCDALRLKAENREKNAEELRQLAVEFVSFPSDDPNDPFVHSTGGAVDLTLTDSEGRELDMGTGFDDFTDAAHTSHFETLPPSSVQRNRRMLYNAMTAAGFTNYPNEWWHYDFGDRFWAAITQKDSIYPGEYTQPRTP